jgi:peptidyl-prolyl cis-trans isomerase D
MLQNLREHVHGWVAAVIAGILCLAFALWGIEYYISGGPAQLVVAKVDGFDITQDQWDAAYNRGRQAQQIQFNDPVLNEAYQNKMKMQALNGLVQSHALTQAAKKSGYVISPVQVGVLIQQTPAFQQEGRFSYPLFRQALQNVSYTPEVFAEEIAKSSLLSQVQRSFVESNFSLPNETQQHILLQHETRDFGYFIISPTPFLSKVVTQNKEIEDYYAAHGKDFMQPEQVSIEYVLLSTEGLDKKIHITPQEVAQYYEENKAAFPSDPKSSQTKAELLASVEKALRQQKTEQWIVTQSDALSNIAYTHPDTLKPAADAIGVAIQTTDFFTKQGEKKGMLSNAKVLAAAFSESVLKEGNNSDLIPIDDRTAIVLRKHAYNPAEKQPLQEVRGNIERYLKNQAAQKAAVALGEKIKQTLQTGTAPEKLATEYSLPWVKKNKLSREDKTTPPEILRFVFDQPAPQPDKKWRIQGGSLPKGEYLVTALTSVLTGLPAVMDATAQKNMQQEIARSWGGLDYDLYLAQQMEQAKIKMEVGAKK